MYEYDYFNGDHFITFDIIGINEENQKIMLAISNEGKISRDTFNLLTDKNGERYFEYGLFYETRIYLNEFKEVA